ncbi:hypothetical protein GCK72_013731 [Caenorhabditis remanei]|uniref:C-type lectin domain-containing protein n=1 Tax=Caenorhabditis remanei TaxID=31234 RepID=A0A6A5GRU6_CAERE|nr:hypothetical protein GCK72_013731 [Caenorhabditis remanei]KAF1757276.1 hypothetical protein GCK72_013731 [Caenorhabditis remanei]
MDQPTAKSLCINQKASISGLENMNETNYVKNSVYWEMVKNYTEYYGGWGIWIDGEKKYECRAENTTSLPGPCNGVNGFNFLDKTLQKKGGYDWDGRNPDGYRGYQNCIMMMISRSYKNGKFDDLICSDKQDFYKRGVLCGLLAK